MISMVSVISVDGKLTNDFDPAIDKWTSKEDKSHFRILKESSEVLIMGRCTYDAVKRNIVLTRNTLRIVVTSNPNKYAGSSVSNQLEFTDDTPQNIIMNLESRGYKNALLLGGSQINTLFLRDKLVNTMILTIEPKLFGKGHDLVSGSFDVNLRLKKIEQLNKRGTLLCVYDIVY